jgi:hypothetical protein
LEGELEVLSGINQVQRGRPEANLRSGSALALVDAKAVQYNSLITAAFQRHVEAVCLLLIQILQEFPDPEQDRAYSIAGRHKRHQLKNFRPEKIEKINRVVVRATNALMKTLSGRLELATLMLQNELIKTPEQMLTVIETGNLDTLTESETAQLSLIRAENTALMEKRPAEASPIDDHVLHIREHAAVANSPEIRAEDETMDTLHSHIMQHLQMLTNEGTQSLQVILGYQAPIPAGPQAAPKGSAPPPKPNNDGPIIPGQGLGPDTNTGQMSPKIPQLPAGAVG